jgi:hypothetical protein
MTSILAECVARDRDVARVVRTLVGRTPADENPESAPADPLDATLPRTMLSEKPPVWPS